MLYHITFTPDDPELGKAYRQMEDLYAMIVNTFHFLSDHGPISELAVLRLRYNAEAAQDTQRRTQAWFERYARRD